MNDSLAGKVVITTYQTLNTDFAIPKDVDTTEELEWLEENGCVSPPMTLLTTHLCRFSGLLARMKFYRVICDEAQYIRNRNTLFVISLITY